MDSVIVVGAGIGGLVAVCLCRKPGPLVNEAKSGEPPPDEDTCSPVYRNSMRID
jgi:hypothetical protein